MGCYGIGINRILASLIEAHHDDNGILWPITVAPFEVLVTCVNQDDQAVSRTAQSIYNELDHAGVEVLLDDRPLRGGPKFKDADLIGIPIRITVGSRSVKEGVAELKLRHESESQQIGLEQVAHEVVDLVHDLKEQLKG